MNTPKVHIVAFNTELNYDWLIYPGAYTKVYSEGFWKTAWDDYRGFLHLLGYLDPAVRDGTAW